MIGFVLLLLLPTPTIWFSLDHKWNIRGGVISGIRILFSLDHKLYASDYDSFSVASENQPLKINPPKNQEPARIDFFIYNIFVRVKMKRISEETKGLLST